MTISSKSNYLVRLNINMNIAYSIPLTETLRNCERGYLVSKVFDITLLINAIWVIMGYY